MTMAAGTDHTKLTRQQANAELHKSASRMHIDTNIKAHIKSEVQQSVVEESIKGIKHDKDSNDHNHTNEKGKHAHHEEEKHKDSKKVRITKKKEKRRKDKKEDGKDTEQSKSSVTQMDEVVERKESFRNFVFDKVKAALSTVYSDGVTNINVDNVTSLMKSLDISSKDKWFAELIRNSIADNFGEIVPLELDKLTMKAQEENDLVDVDECLESAFNLIDFDEDGFLSQMDIRMLMLRLGEMVNDYAVDDILDTVDLDKDGKISMRDFRNFLLDRDVPSRKEAKLEAEKVMREQERAQKEIAAQEADLDSQQAENSEKKSQENSETSVRGIKKFNKLRSSIIGLKLKTGKDASKIISDKSNNTLREDDNFDVSSMTTEQQDEFMNSASRLDGASSGDTISPREFSSGVRKTSFFGGFINRDAALLQGLTDTTTEEIVATVNDTDKKYAMRFKGQKTENETNANLVHSPKEIFKDKNKDLEAKNGGRLSNEYSQHLVLGDHIQDYIHSALEDSPMPLEIEHDSLNIPPPDLSEIEISYPAVTSTPSHSPKRSAPSHSQRRLSEIYINDDLISVMKAGNVRFFSNKLDASYQNLTVRNVSPLHVRPHRRSSSCNIEDHKHHIPDNGDNFNNTFVIDLRPRRKSSTSSKVEPMIYGNEQFDDRSNAEYSPEHATQDEIDSDEGIELGDEEVVQRAVHIPMSPKASTTSLRIYLPRGDILHGNDHWEDERSRGSKPRPRITIDLKNFSEDGDDEEEKESVDNRATLGEHEVKHVFRPTRESNVSGVKPDFNSTNSDDLVSENTPNYEENDHQNYVHKRHRYSPLSNSKTTSSILRNQYVYSSENESNILSEDETTHSRYSVQIKHNYNDDSNIDFISTKHSESQRNKSSSHGNAQTMRPMKASHSYQSKEFQTKSAFTVKQLPNRYTSNMIHRDVPTLLISNRSAGLEESIPGNYTEPARGGQLPSKTYTEKWKHKLILEKPRYTRTACETAQEREVIKHKRTPIFQKKLSAHKEQTISTDSSNTITERMRNTEHRKLLLRSLTSSELCIDQKSDNERERNRSHHEKSVPTKRSVSATTSRSVKTATEYKPISVLDLSKHLQIETPYKKKPSHPQTYYRASNIVPLSRMVNVYQSSQFGYRNHIHYLGGPRQYEQICAPYFHQNSTINNTICAPYFHQNSTINNTICAPYFLHNSSANGTIASGTRQTKIKSKKGSKKQSQITEKLEHRDQFEMLNDKDVTTLVGDLKDYDIIPDEVIFKKVKKLTGKFNKK